MQIFLKKINTSLSCLTYVLLDKSVPSICDFFMRLQQLREQPVMVIQHCHLSDHIGHYKQTGHLHISLKSCRGYL